MDNSILHLYLVTDRPDKCKIGLLESVKEAVRGGVTVVQYRQDELSYEDMLAEVKPISDFLKSAGVPLIINNHVKLALEIDAEGVHIGQSDMPVEEARRLLGPDKILGLSTSTREQVLAADPELLDYLGCGPIFPTISKMNAPTDIGVEGFAELAALTPLPVVAIGGLDAERTAAIRATGKAAGVALVSAICGVDSPYEAALQLK